MRLRKNQKGFTMVEIIVAFLILAIVAGMAATMLVSSSKFFQRNVISDLDKLSADEIHKLAIDRITRATSVLVTGSPLPSMEKPYEHCITVQGGRFLFDGADIYGDEYYHGRDLQMEVKADPDKSQLSLDFLLYERDGGGPVYRTSQKVDTAAVKLINLEMASKRPEKPGSGSKGATPDPEAKVYATGKLLWGLPKEGGGVEYEPTGIDDYIYFGYTDLEPYNEGGIEIHYPGTVNEELRLIADVPMGTGQNKGRYIAVYVGGQELFVAVDKDYDESLPWGDPANKDHVIAIPVESLQVPGQNLPLNKEYFKLKIGDFVQYKGSWYRAMTNFDDPKIDAATSAPDLPDSQIWKHIDPPTVGSRLNYEAGDVVVAPDGKYYMAITSGANGYWLCTTPISLNSWAPIKEGTSFVVTTYDEKNFDGYWELEITAWNKAQYRRISDGKEVHPDDFSE